VTITSPGGSFVLAVLATSLLAALMPARVSADWYEDFDSGFSQTWTFTAVDDVGDPPATGTSEFAIMESGADDYLRMSHSTQAFADGGGGVTDAFGLVSEVFTDVLVSAELNSAPTDGQQSILAVIGRGDPATGEAYIAGIDFANSFFAIARSDDLEFFLVPLAVDATVGISPSATYYVEFSLIGSSLTAQLFDASGTTLLSTINGVDGLYGSGVSGVLVETAYDGFGNPVGPIVGTFDDVEAVPEPSLSVLLVAGFAVLTFLTRKTSRA
jgi:hypothetical protein